MDLGERSDDRDFSAQDCFIRGRRPRRTGVSEGNGDRFDSAGGGRRLGRVVRTMGIFAGDMKNENQRDREFARFPEKISLLFGSHRVASIRTGRVISGISGSSVTFVRFRQNTARRQSRLIFPIHHSHVIFLRFELCLAVKKLT